MREEVSMQRPGPKDCKSHSSCWPRQGLGGEQEGPVFPLAAVWTLEAQGKGSDRRLVTKIERKLCHVLLRVEINRLREVTFGINNTEATVDLDKTKVVVVVVL